MKRLNFSYLIIIGIASLLFVPFLGYVNLFDWDEINFAECAREMIVSGDFTTVKINFLPFWEKPPLFIWMQAASMKAFGVNEFAARFPNAVCGIVTLLVIFKIASKIYDTKFAWYWVLTYAGSTLPFFYFKSGIIDPWFNLFIFLGIYKLALYSNDFSPKRLSASALYIGLATLTKGPAAILILFLCIGVYLISTRFKLLFTLKNALLFMLLLTAVSSVWFAILLINNQGHIIKEFISYQVRLFNTEDAGHGGPFYYHFLVLITGCFPASIFAFYSFRKFTDTPFHRLFKKWMTILFWVVLILFSIVKTKIIHYSSLCYFPISFFAAITLFKITTSDFKVSRFIRIGTIALASIIGCAIILLPLIAHYKSILLSSGIIKDIFATENLKADVEWSGLEAIPGLMLIAGTPILFYLYYKYQKSIYVLGVFLLNIVSTYLSVTLITGKIEGYSQRAAIDFFSNKSKEKCGIQTIGYKSYAHLFYGKTKETQDLNKLLSQENIPVYFSSKINSVDDIQANYPQLEEIERKNGFVFWIKKAK